MASKLTGAESAAIERVRRAARKLARRRAATNPRAAVNPLEKVEQAHIEKLLTQLGGKVYHIGTKRRRGDYQGTMQTPGIPDVFAFLPAPRLIPEKVRNGAPIAVWIEVKREGEKIAAGSEQDAFRLLCFAAGGLHWSGTLNDIIEELVAGGWVRADSFPHYRQPKPR
jgi:hypothetical protein